MNPIRSSAALSCAAVLTVSLAALLLVVPGGASALSPSEERAADWLTRMDDYFESNPELKTTPGSGYKPFSRIKWEYERQKLGTGELPAPDARWNAMLEKRAREEALGPAPRNTWFALGPDNFGGRMLAIDFHPSGSPVYVGAANGGVWSTTDNGASWTPLSDNLMSLAVGGLAVSKTNPDIIVIGTGEGTNNIDRVGGVGVLRSTDAGATWITTDYSFNLGSTSGTHVVTAGPNGTFLMGNRDGLYRSSDDGATWQEIITPGEIYDIKWKPGTTDTVYLVKGNGPIGNNVKISTDDGLTWTKAGGGAGGQPNTATIGKSKIALSAADPDVIYALFGNPAGSGITGLYKSTNGGTNWTAQNTSSGLLGGQTWYNLILACDPSDPDVVIAGAVSLLRSQNSGVSWTNVGSGVHVDHHACEYLPGSSSVVWLGNDGGMYRSDSDGANFSWLDRNNGLQTYQFYDICVNNGPTSYYVMGGTQDNGTDKWSGTTTWSNGLGADGMVCNIDVVGGTTVYATIQNGGHRKNTNSGSGGWSTITSGLFGSGSWVTPRDLDAQDTNHLFTSTGSGIFRSTNGSSWTNVAAHTARWISISPVDGDICWTVTGIPYLTTDDGGSWAQTSAFPFTTGGSTKILAHPTDANSAFVTFGGFSNTVAKVALTTDLGVTWADVSGDFPALPANGIAVNPSDTTQWFVGTDLGVWYSENGGTNWNPLGTGLPNSVIDDLEIQNSLQKLVVGTHGRGAWEIDIPTSGQVDAPVEVSQARNLMLDAPYPNPVRDRTMLRFAAKSEGPVTLTIYDVQGRLVTPVTEMARGDGFVKTAPWFTDDVPSGVYFAVLRSAEESVSRKVVVAR